MPDMLHLVETLSSHPDALRRMASNETLMKTLLKFVENGRDFSLESSNVFLSLSSTLSG